MRLLAYIALLILVVTCRSGAEEGMAQLTFHVTDDFGNAVANAPVWMSTAEGWRPGKTDYGHSELRKANGTTDTNGFVTLKLHCKTGYVRYSVFVPPARRPTEMTMPIGQKVYYIDLGAEHHFANVEHGKWQPWNSKVEIVLKEVLKPIPMYARFLESGSLNVPAYNTPLGYDLCKSDWLPPYGKGETADFIFTLDCQLGGTRKDGIQIFDAILRLSFSNNGDGIQEVEAAPRTGSIFSLSRFAPETGFKSDWVSKAFAHEDTDNCEFKENQNFYYRVRTKKDETGRIISALYGKIVGPIFYEVRARGANMQMKYYLNPTPNDRNMEFDPSRNLFTDLNSFEQVHEP